MSIETDADNNVTGNEPSLDALVDSLVEEVTGKQEGGEPAVAKSQESKKEEPAGKPSPSDSDDETKAKLSKLERDLSAARRAFHESQTELNRLKKGSEGSPKSSGSTKTEGDEESDTDAVDSLFEKHFEELTAKHPDWDETKVRSRASKKAWDDVITTKAESIARKIIEQSPVSKVHEDQIVQGSMDDVSKFIASAEELKDDTSEFYRFVDKTFIDRLDLLERADGKKYLDRLDNGTVRVSRTAHKHIDVRDVLERAYKEAKGHFGPSAKPAKQPKGSSPRDEDDAPAKKRGEIESMDELADLMTDFSFS